MTLKFTHEYKIERQPKVGNKIRIKDDLQNHKDYGRASVVEPMKEYCGKRSTITHVEGDVFYIKLDNEDWAWTKAMTELIKWHSNSHT